MQSEIIKVCKIHGDLTLDKTWSYIHKIRKKRYYRCLPCKKERDKKYFTKIKLSDEARERKKEYEKKRWLEKKAEITLRRQSPGAKAKRREWYEKNKEREIKRNRTRQHIARETLNNNYIKRIIASKHGITYNQILEDSIFVKKIILEINRLIRVLKKGSKRQNERIRRLYQK